MKKKLFVMIKTAGILLVTLLMLLSGGCGKGGEPQPESVGNTEPADKRVTIRTADGEYKEVFVVIDENGNVTYQSPDNGAVVEVFKEDTAQSADNQTDESETQCSGNSFIEKNTDMSGGNTAASGHASDTGRNSGGAADRNFNVPSKQDAADTENRNDTSFDSNKETDDNDNGGQDVPQIFDITDYTGVRVHGTAPYGNAAEAYAFLNAVCSKNMSQSEIVQILYNAVASATNSRANSELHNLCNYAGIECHQYVAVYEDGSDSGYQPLLIRADGREGFYAPFENLHGGFNGNVFDADEGALIAFLNRKNAEFIEAGIDGYITGVRLIRGM